MTREEEKFNRLQRTLIASTPIDHKIIVWEDEIEYTILGRNERDCRDFIKKERQKEKAPLGAH